MKIIIVATAISLLCCLGCMRDKPSETERGTKQASNYTAEYLSFKAGMISIRVPKSFDTAEELIAWSKNSAFASHIYAELINRDSGWIVVTFVCKSGLETLSALVFEKNGSLRYEKKEHLKRYPRDTRWNLVLAEPYAITLGSDHAFGAKFEKDYLVLFDSLGKTKMRLRIRGKDDPLAE